MNVVLRLARSVLPLCLLLAGALAISACGPGDGSQATDAPTASPAGTPAATGPTAVPGPGVTDTQITLGMTNDLAGTGDTPYAAITLAIQAHFRKVNAGDGGVCGRNLVLAAEDDIYSPQVALEKTKKLVEQTGVLAMIGGLGTEAQQGVAAYLNDPDADGDKADGVPDLFVSSGWSGWADAAAYPWTIGYIPDYRTEGAVLARYANTALAGKKLGIIYSDDVAGKDYLAGFTAGLTDPASLVSQYAFPEGATTLADQLKRAQADGAEAVLLAATPDMAALAIREAAAISYAPTWLLSYTNAPSMLASTLGGGSSADQLLAGFAMLDGAVSTAYLLSPVENEDAPQMAEHTRIMQTYQGPEVSSLTVYGQSLAELAVQALAASCSNLTRAGVMAAAESLTGAHASLMLPGITVDLSHSDHRAVQALQPVVIDADSSVTPEGPVISAADVTASPPLTAMPPAD